MITTLLGIAALALLTAVALVIRNYRAFRGTRLIICPETCETAAVELDAPRAAETAVYQEKPELRLSACSRWPERRHCGQACLSQIEKAPKDCLVRTIVTNWYQGAACVVCHQPIRDIDWSFHKAALMRPGFPATEWTEIQPENLPVVLETSYPVCWNCHLAEQFRREHADLVVERPRRLAAR